MTQEQPPVYLDDQGNPVTAVYLDDEGNPQGEQSSRHPYATPPLNSMTKEQKVDHFMNDPFLKGAATGGVMSIGPQAIDATRQVIHGLARRMYQGALKPTKAVVSRTPGGEQALADIGLREGLNVSRGGVGKATAAIEGLDDQVAQALAGSNKTVSRHAVSKRLNDTYGQFKDQVNPEADLNAIRNVGGVFKRTMPSSGQIPVQQAQRVKQGTYRAQAKKYGQQGGAEVEAEKALARGLKEEISNAVPAVAPLNRRSSELIQVRKALEDATRRSGNRDTIGLTDVIAGGTNPKLLAATLAMRAVPQSMGARAINRTGQAGPTPDALHALVRALVMGQDK
jgi:hypothetical protein